ncbi:DUF4087 domain-containing protein [Caballeronia sp. LZ034LL]|uniref:DUF4087 domain-containing protein n=1 Tax=Caballeronia sp. LZ034LL TaxID=3038567 RepID=UPI0028619BA6|nr:DUF4087 domain-containing protein [Caballeronia sp. LZ034LL]MDR5835379.1 DUF4087 domain-containing protein [Caballeronia sp. LZ034LL]
MKYIAPRLLRSFFSLESVNKRLLIAACAIVTGLAGCASHTLDYRNAQIVNGKIYAADANSPFSGKITNVPYGTAFNSQQGLDLMLSALQDGSRLVMYGTLCDVKVDAGQLDGDAVCRTARSDTVRLQASFDEAALAGDMTIYATDGKTILVSAHFKRGQPDGEVKQLLGSTGKTLRTVHWDEGKLDGETKIWDPKTGDLTYAANYRQGMLNGDFYSQSSRPDEEPLVTKGTYDNGKFTGTKPASFANDEYRYDIHVDAKYTYDVIQNQDDIDRMNRFGRQVVDCVHRTAYSVAKEHGRTYLTSDEEKQLVVQCKAHVTGTGEATKDNGSSVLAAVADGSDAATAYLQSVNTDQNQPPVVASASTNGGSGGTEASTPVAAPTRSSTQAAQEKRCGWIENSLPGGELTLQDRDGTWAISSADGLAAGFDRMPATDKGDSCGCLSVAVDKQSKRVTQIFGGEIIPNSKCEADAHLRQ